LARGQIINCTRNTEVGLEYYKILTISWTFSFIYSKEYPLQWF
jgi:hypothetical protein